jgi:predicted ATPase
MGSTTIAACNTDARAALRESVLDQFRGDVQSAQEHSAIARGLTTEYGAFQHLGIASVIEGWAEGFRGDVESAISNMRDAIAGLGRYGVHAPTFLLFPLAETYLRVGQTEEADRIVAQALEIVQQTGHRMQEAELCRLKGELLHHSSDSTKAEACFRQAITIAQAQSAKWWELRATTSLARLLAKQGRPAVARAMLAEIYGWFSEGFDTTDLKDAKELLNELSS